MSTERTVEHLRARAEALLAIAGQMEAHPELRIVEVDDRSIVVASVAELLAWAKTLGCQSVSITKDYYDDNTPKRALVLLYHCPFFVEAVDDGDLYRWRDDSWGWRSRARSRISVEQLASYVAFGSVDMAVASS